MKMFEGRSALLGAAGLIAGGLVFSWSSLSLLAGALFLAGLVLCGLGALAAQRARPRRENDSAALKILAAEEHQARKAAEAALRVSEEFNRRCLECSNDCVSIIGVAGEFLFINERGRSLLELEQESAWLGKSWLDLFHQIDRHAAAEAIDTASKGKSANFHAYCPTAQGTPKWWNFLAAPVPEAAGDIRKLLVVWRDVTEHMQVEKALRESEEGFRKIFEEGPIGIVLSDLSFCITKVNNAFHGMLGYTEKELAGQSLLDLILPVDRQLEAQQLEQIFSGEISKLGSERRFITKSKQTIWVHLTTSVIRDPEGKPLYSVSMMENIHERKSSEEKLLAYQQQLQSLASELSLSEERERRRIATGLHDRIGQALAFAKLKLSSLSKAENQAHAGEMREIRELIEQTMTDIRSLTFELSPPVLYELGLAPAIEWLLRKIQHEHGILARFHDDGQPKPLHEDFRVVLFQAVRETLVNVVKHAQAKHAQVLLRRDGDALRVIIEDDGIGFSSGGLQSPSDPAHGFGLFSIRERVEYLGGAVKIRSEPGAGTRITLIAPLKLEAPSESLLL